ncbi:putative integral membrane protein [Cryptosporidium felis]|nr:putative integral membrane protein [Cryptosporidium felis]
MSDLDPELESDSDSNSDPDSGSDEALREKGSLIILEYPSLSVPLRNNLIFLIDWGFSSLLGISLFTQLGGNTETSGPSPPPMKLNSRSLTKSLPSVTECKAETSTRGRASGKPELLHSNTMPEIAVPDLGDGERKTASQLKILLNLMDNNLTMGGPDKQVHLLQVLDLVWDDPGGPGSAVDHLAVPFLHCEYLGMHGLWLPISVSDESESKPQPRKWLFAELLQNPREATGMDNISHHLQLPERGPPGEQVKIPRAGLLGSVQESSLLFGNTDHPADGVGNPNPPQAA